MQNILVVDDEPDVRDSVKYVLDRAGYSVLSLIHISAIPYLR